MTWSLLLSAVQIFHYADSNSVCYCDPRPRFLCWQPRRETRACSRRDESGFVARPLLFLLPECKLPVGSGRVFIFSFHSDPLCLSTRLSFPCAAPAVPPPFSIFPLLKYIFSPFKEGRTRLVPNFTSGRRQIYHPHKGEAGRCFHKGLLGRRCCSVPPPEAPEKGGWGGGRSDLGRKRTQTSWV